MILCFLVWFQKERLRPSIVTRQGIVISFSTLEVRYHYTLTCEDEDNHVRQHEFEDNF